MKPLAALVLGMTWMIGSPSLPQSTFHNSTMLRAAPEAARRYSVHSGLPLARTRNDLVALEGNVNSDADSVHSTADHRSRQTVYELRGGMWWTGRDFVTRTWYAADGVFTATRPSRVDSVIELNGRYVVPPFAEGHTHTIAYVKSRIDDFIDEGVFYAMVMNAHSSTLSTNVGWFNHVASVDVNATAAALTAPNGHPVQIGLRGGQSLEGIDGDWITAVTSGADLHRKWPAVASLNNDFVKVFLVDSERYRKLSEDSTIAPRYRGMDPTLLPEIVRLAHASGLRVAVHVRTGYDFRVAVNGGSDVVAHMPGFSMGPSGPGEVHHPERLAEMRDPERFHVRPTDARLAARQGTRVVTTVGSLGSVPVGVARDISSVLEEALRIRRRVLQRNLNVLKDEGVEVLLGSDAGEGSVVNEVLLVHVLGVFQAHELLRMLCETTPRFFFAGRQIGRLEEGYEASLLALGGNPLEDLAHIRDVRVRLKQGRPRRPGVRAER